MSDKVLIIQLSAVLSGAGRQPEFSQILRIIVYQITKRLQAMELSYRVFAEELPWPVQAGPALMARHK
jgi:hypothetical protein